MLGRAEVSFHQQVLHLSRPPVDLLTSQQITSKTLPDIGQHMIQAEKVGIANLKSNRRSCARCATLLLGFLQPVQSRSHAQVVWRNQHLQRNCGILYNN